jgi:multidrug efflux pump subunit AcrA (membrane-fusion protein)
MSSFGGEARPERHRLILLLALASLLAVMLHAAAQAEAPVLAPRLDAKGSAFELLGMVKGNALTVYLDDVNTNEPIPKARFDIDTGDKNRRILLKETEPGLYWGQADWLTQPGETDFVITVKAGKRSDLLGGTLKIPSPPPAIVNLWAVWQTRVVFALGAVLGLLLPRLLRMLLRPRAPSRKPAAAAGASVAQPASSAAVRSAATVGAFLLLIFGWAAPGVAMPAGPGHSHGPDDVTVDVAPDNQPADSPRRLPDGSLFVPKPAQRVLAIRTSVTAVSEIPATTRVFGRVIADPTASGRIQAGIPGRIDAGENGLFIIGQKVERGQVVCSIVPIINPIDNANIQQQMSQIDGEVRQITATAEKAASGDIAPLSPRELQNMQLDLMSLRQRREGIQLVMNERDSLRIPLRSPSTGIIAISNVLAGQIVEAKDILFEVIDPQRIWIEAVAFDMSIVNDIDGAIAVTDNGFKYDLAYIGRAPRLRQQAIPLNFKITNPDANLTVGSPANVFIRGRTMQKGIVLPLKAITTTASGQPIVFEHVSAEHFVPVLIRSEAVDGDNAVVMSGLEPGRRIVVDGAGLLAQVR